MSKEEKYQGIPSPADRRKVDPSRPARTGRPHKKEYPRHWEIRTAPFGGFYVWDNKHRISDYPWRKDDPEAEARMRKLRDDGDLDSYLDFMAERHPEAASWPVRFISMQPIPTKREVIQ